MPPNQPPKKPPARPRRTAGGKPKDTSRVTTYVRKDGTKVQGHVRENPGWTRAKKVGKGAAFSGLTCGFILIEASFTALSMVGCAAITLATFGILFATELTAVANKRIATNKKTSTRARRSTRPRTARRTKRPR